MVYINWLSMVRAGLLGLEFYTPESKSWRQVTPTPLPSIANRSGDLRVSRFSLKVLIFGRVWCCVARVYVEGQNHFRCVPHGVTGLDLCLRGLLFCSLHKVRLCLRELVEAYTVHVT